mmetsp:Transcript_78616/g.163401  ORF Transcript_78616/g.163401 Transcript_78616/m.163401 type:complete len:383 (-) Transcript_78616:121-1269(-)|eukprot:CAMPEP_0206448790 /NCGR_PEP_ID=MMETSP0324_2-20121206/17697_1 /ASSEMBLY_ACC=CAM_ASM_000836 /TAXON_ID=2866 /ORGANISM="Crypthecodinium cohnii, Strain Seligo" /LENGTH=382 /DNA_ID=CAMNT_0053918031 /DNA_START=190 /DNA_END=1338 /DNA_ORIENTATION=+
MSKAKNRAKKQARNNAAQAKAKAKAAVRNNANVEMRPVGAQNTPLVKKAGKKKKSGGSTNAPIMKMGRAIQEQAVASVEEDGMMRHQMLTKAHGDAITSIIMAEDAVYTASRDKILKRWKPQLNPQGKFELKPDVEVPLGEIAWCLLSVGEWIFSGLADGRIRGYSKSGREINLEGHTKKVTTLLLHEQVLVSGSADNTLRFWQYDPNAQTFVCTHSLTQGIPGGVTCLAVLAQGLWVGGTAGVALVELATLTVVLQVQPKRPVSGMLKFTDHMIVAYSEGSVKIFTALGVETHSQNPLPAGHILCLAGLDSGPRVLCGHIKGQVSSITLPLFQLKQSWQTFARCKVQSICCTGHDGIFLVGAENGDLQLWQRVETQASKAP